MQSKSVSPCILEFESLINTIKGKPVHILHVDDDIGFLQVSKVILESEYNFKVDISSSTSEALEKIATQNYDVIVSDYEMPQQDGLQFLKEIRQLKTAIPFILFTGKGREETAVNALKLGVDGYYSKTGSIETVYCELAHGILASAKHMQTQREVQFAANLFDTVIDSILVHDLNGRIVIFNEEAYKLRGYSKDEFKKLNVSDLEIPGFSGNFKIRIKELLEKGDGIFESVGLRKDKSILPLEIHARIIELEGKRVILSIDRDISGRKNAEGKIEAIEEKYLAAFESSKDALILLTEKGFIDCNQSALSMFDVASVEEFTKCHFSDLSPPIQPNGMPSSEALLIHIRRALWTGKESFNWVSMRTDNSTFTGEVLLSRIKFNNQTVVLATVRDITERLKAEERLKDYINKVEMMNEKLRVVGGLTRHDVRNKLSIVTGYGYLLKKKHHDQSDIVDCLLKMEYAVREIVDIFDFSRIYEQIGMQELSYVAVDKEIKEALLLFSEPLPLVLSQCEGLKVMADSLLRQIFFNFIDNTIKHGAKVTTIKIHYEKTEHNSLRLIYEDDGIGIPKDFKSNLFKEGFSSRGSTGYGLFLIKKMMNVYGWEIQEVGSPDKGVCFFITIPDIDKNKKKAFLIERKSLT